ncbi:MAG: hypothetical protein HOK28_11370 [Deltaproteobacteria bacterium]|nr:hypothetical protein [Deltaproteobacteria bacterium]
MDHGLIKAAKELLEVSDLIDLHVDGLIPHRLFGYDLNVRHSGSYTGGRFMGHLDFPRAIENGCNAAMWSITTNPFKPKGRRWQSFLENVTTLENQVQRSHGRVKIATTWSEFMDLRDKVEHICLPAIQGGNSLAGAPGGCADIPGNCITRVTLVHLTNSLYGITSSPLKGLRGSEGLSGAGRDFVRDLNAHRIFVDLAHINEAGFWDAVECHDASQPLIVTHTGVDGVRDHWRNLTDEQIKVIADSGGTVGVIFEPNFLKRANGPMDGNMILEHMAHIIHVVGDEFVSIGTDYDGMISPPEGLSDPHYPVLVAQMLERNWSEERIQRILGGNFLRSFKALRP